MTITQLYGLNDYDHAKLEVTLTKEDVEQIKTIISKKGYNNGIYFDNNNTSIIHRLLNTIITEAEK